MVYVLTRIVDCCFDFGDGVPVTPAPFLHAIILYTPIVGNVHISNRLLPIHTGYNGSNIVCGLELLKFGGTTNPVLAQGLRTPGEGSFVGGGGGGRWWEQGP